MRWLVDDEIFSCAMYDSYIVTVPNLWIARGRRSGEVLRGETEDVARRSPSHGHVEKVVVKACVNATTKARRELRDRDRWRSATDTFLSKNTVSSSFRFGADLFMEHSLSPYRLETANTWLVTHSVERNCAQWHKFHNTWPI